MSEGSGWMEAMWRRVRRGVGVAAVGLGVASLAGGCSVSQEQELQLGAANFKKFEDQAGGRFPDPVVQSYVSRVGMSMVSQAGRPEMQWQFHVLNSGDINAFAVPGGYIYITQGLLFRMQNEAQLAGVLGHEIGHIAGRHSARRIERSQTVAVLTAGVGILAEQAGYAVAGDLGNVASQLYLLRYSRDHEREADMLGLKYMTTVGYNPRGIVQLMEILQAASGGKSSGGLGEWTQTHPDPGNRIAYLNRAIAADYSSAEQTGKWGVPEFRQNVLDRKKTSLGPVDLSHPVLWCGTCREEAGKTASGGAGGELLREVAVAEGG